MKIVLLFFFFQVFSKNRSKVPLLFFFRNQSLSSEYMWHSHTHARTQKKVFRCSIIKIREVYTEETQPTVYNTASFSVYSHTVISDYLHPTIHKS